MKIEFYIPKDQVIPTQFRLKVDGKYDVYYDKDTWKFAYKFQFFRHQGVTLEMAYSITDEIVHKLEWQSYDHGAEWRECGIREIVNDEFELSITVFFRKRDAT